MSTMSSDSGYVNSNYINPEKELQLEFEKEFGTLTTRQLWVLTKFAKRVRLRARNNLAFNNLCNRLFPYAEFRQVTKTRQDSSTYPGLQIKVGDDELIGDDE